MTLREIDKRVRKGKGSNAPLQTIDYTSQEITRLAQIQNLRIVLDGQQRITSIYRAIVGLDSVYVILHEHLLALDIEAINALSLEDIVQDITGEESPVAISVKLSDAYDADKKMLEDEELSQIFMKTVFAQKRLKEAAEPQLKIAKKLYRRAIYQLIDLYKQQKLVAFYLLDMSINKFCTFFERSNSRGIQLNFTDILAAKLYHGFNLRKKVEEFESQYKIIKLNREIIVRTIAYIVGTEKNGPVSIDKDYILEHLDAVDFQNHWDTVCELYVSSLQYLISQNYILSQNWMPSENMVLPLMIFLKRVKSFDRMNQDQKQFLEFWYWSSVLSNRYSGSSNETIIVDCSALSQVAHGERIAIRNYFNRLRPIITEPDDLFGYTKKSSAIYRGILNLLGYATQGLSDWNSTQKINTTMDLEDHHIYPRAYISNSTKLEDMSPNEAEQLVDCVVNRTLIPKIVNIQVGKKAPSVYLSDLQKKQNSQLAACLSSHLIPEEIITDSTWDTLFKLFLEERAQSIYSLIEHYTTEYSAAMITKYGIQSDTNDAIKVTIKPRLKEMIASGKVFIGDRVFTSKKPDQLTTIIDGDTVEFEGKKLPINTWGQQMTGWSTINIYSSILLERTGQPLKNLRERIE